MGFYTHIFNQKAIDAYTQSDRYYSRLPDGIDLGSDQGFVLSPFRDALIKQGLSHIGANVTEEQMARYGDTGYCADAQAYFMENIFEQNGLEDPFPWQRTPAPDDVYTTTRDVRQFMEDHGATYRPADDIVPKPGDLLSIEYLERDHYAEYGQREKGFDPAEDMLTGHGHTAMIIDSFYINERMQVLTTIDANLKLHVEDTSTVMTEHYIYDSHTGDIYPVDYDKTDWEPDMESGLYGVMTATITNIDKVPGVPETNHWMEQHLANGGYHYVPEPPVNGYDVEFRQQNMQDLSHFLQGTWFGDQYLTAPTQQSGTASHDKTLDVAN